MQTTSADEFLSELGGISALILDVLDCPRKAQWHWPSCYLLYVDLDRLDGLLVQVQYMLQPPFDSIGEQPPLDERVRDDNALFEQLDTQLKAIVTRLFPMYRSTGANPANPAARERLGAHLHPKSGWYQTFLDEYCSGAVTRDGDTLQRVALPIDPTAAGEHIDNTSARCMLRHQSFDLSTPTARSSLAHATAEVRTRLRNVLAAMTAYLAANCTMTDLLHPRSH